jgi:glycosyltransferase involved in cell wall biosynthesis
LYINLIEPYRIKFARRKYKKKLNPLVSIIIPTYNRGDILISRTLPSILNQTYKNIEIIIVGDNCQDKTGTLIKKKFPHIQNLNFINLNKRGNYPIEISNRWFVAGCVPGNEGLNVSKGDWIVWFDDDDIMASDHIESLLNFAINGNFEFVAGLYEEERFGKKEILGYRTDSIPEFGGHSTWMYRSYLKYFKYNINSWRKKWNKPSPDEARASFIKNVIFIRKLEVYFNKELNDVYGKEAINIEYSHLMPKKIKAASYFTDHPKKIIVENFQYRPELYNPKDIVFEIGGKKYINTYKPITIEPSKGNLELWEELLDYLFPDLETKTHMEDFISAHVQHAGKKIRHAPLIVSPHQRIGKGRMFAAIRKILGEDNTAEIDLTRALNQSKDYLTNKQLVLIDELKSESNWAEAQKLLNTLKRNITEEWHGSRFLYQDFKDVYSCTNYILFSNHTNALSINKNDERYWVVRCDVSPKQQIFYKHFSDWLKTPEAAQHLLWHYKNREISETFDFDGHAPRTIWSNQMSNEAKHPFIQRAIEDFDQNLMPFINDIVSIVDVRIHYKNVGIGKVRANEIHNALLEVGGRKLGQSKVSLLDREWFPTLYSIRNHEKYENVPVNQLGALYTPLFHPDTEKDL